MTSYRQT